MTRGEINSNLCYFDERNEYNSIEVDDDKRDEHERCYCDNCFYGRTELAEELIKLINLYQIQ